MANTEQTLELNDIVARYHAATDAETEARARAKRMSEMRVDAIRELRALGFSCRKIGVLVGLRTPRVQELAGKGSARRAASARASDTSSITPAR